MKKKSFVTALFSSFEFKSDDIERYRTKKITSSGASITDTDNERNDLPGQIKLKKS